MSKKADIICQENKLLLSGELDFTNVMSVYQKSLLMLKPCAEIVVDFSQLKSSDSSGLALMMEWEKLGKKAQKQVKFKHVSSKLISIAKAAGMEAMFFRGEDGHEQPIN